MKNLLIFTVSAALLAVTVVVFAHGQETMGHEGHMMKRGCDRHMTESMMGMCGHTGDQKFLDETRELRKSLHEKRFEYFEAVRDQKTSQEHLKELEKEMLTLRESIAEKLPDKALNKCGGCDCWQ